MTNDNNSIELMISRLTDNDLSDDEQRELFLILAENPEARQTLADYMSIKKDTFRHYAEIYEDLPSLSGEVFLLRQPQQKHSGMYKRITYLSSAAAAVMLVLLAWSQFNFSVNNEKYLSLQREHSKLKSDYTLMSKAGAHSIGISSEASLPAERENSIVIRKPVRAVYERLRPAKKISAESSRAGIAQKGPAANSQYAYLSRAHVVEIDKNDFLVPQIPGN